MEPEKNQRRIKNMMLRHNSTVGCWSSMGKEMDLIPHVKGKKEQCDEQKNKER